jgi:peptidoglycan hydrolase-like protein with peptidoglycan-binding domain
VKRRTFLTGALAAVGLAGLGGLGVTTLGHGSPAGAADGPTGTTLPPTTKTTKVTKRDLVQTEQVDGRLGYGATRMLAGGPEGTITALPDEGTVLNQGDTLWEVDGVPGPALLIGARPMWRTMSTGVDKGEDIRQLEENLVALGYADPAVVTVDDSYTSATAAAVKRWQKARGLEQTGRVEPSEVVFAAASVRVATLKATVGDKGWAQTQVIEVTGSEQIVAVHLDTGKAGVAKQDDPVTVELTDGRTVDATVRSVGTVVHTDTSGQGSTTNYLDVIVALAGGQAVGLDDAPVTVNFVRSSAKGVLAVPVRALLALAEGGYALERITATGTELVGVELGDTADGYVQVTGNIAEGDTVVTA